MPEDGGVDEEDYRRFRAAAHSTSWGRRLQEADFEDLLHDTVERVGPMMPVGAFPVRRAYFLTAFYRQVVDRWRTRQRERVLEEHPPARPIGPDRPAVLRVVRHALALAVIEERIGSPEARSWWLKKFGDLGAEEILARLDLGIRRDHLYTIISRTGVHLREILHERGYATVLDALDHARDLAEDLAQECRSAAGAQAFAAVLRDVLSVEDP